MPVINKAAEHFLLCEQTKRLSEEAKISKDTQRSYERQAKRDPLTNLPNRREFRYSLSREISNAQRYDYYGALMYIDLDNFKNVNDSLGHSIGDMLLTQVAQRLTEQARSGDTCFESAVTNLFIFSATPVTPKPRLFAPRKQSPHA